MTPYARNISDDTKSHCRKLFSEDFIPWQLGNEPFHVVLMVNDISMTKIY